jgi:hypothetical protein
MKPGDRVKLGDCRVVIGTPSFDGNVCGSYVRSMLGSITKMNELGIGYALSMYEKSTVLPYVRNRIVADFLVNFPSATHLLFIDADMGWPPSAIPELLAHRKDVIAAIGITKDHDPDMRRFCVEAGPAPLHENGLLRVQSVGTGFMMIARHVLEKMWAKYNQDPYPVPPEQPEVGRVSRVFDYDYASPAGWGEDYTFCARWRAMGGEIWVDPSLQLFHIGVYAYTGTYMDWLVARAAQKKAQAAE